ncbi:glycosyltransferase family 4 protein [Pseudoruegeria sp. SK021]|uniref:glycosyltransferase family 4 protein n=1 Tax=Pseudoruegeria sp. SK021 TaxID=1933035 RepID=UPI00143D934A|nr:glycosyltransferase family 4 protein [Pseudoruegeria sp. SK021]
MGRIAFVDPCCTAGYDLPDLSRGGLGGTEATILRLGAALHDQFDITQYQNGRFWPQTSYAGRLRPLAEAFEGLTADTIVVINRWKVALKLRKAYPDTPIYLWLHVFPGRHNRKMGAALQRAGITVICVSHSHARHVTAFLGQTGGPRVTAIYNPIADDLCADATRRDPNRLLFASSPHKGLAEVFGQFAELRRSIPRLKLAVADPGYLRWDVGRVPLGVTFLGSLSHAALVAQMRKSLCLFCPQTSFAETFGLVLAEANAVGTPVLVHAGLGANDEIVGGAGQRIDGCNPAQILDRISLWRDAPPKVSTNPEFRLSRVAQAWTRLLRHPAAQTPQHHDMMV